MKNLILVLFLITSVNVTSQNLKKTFITILDEYIEKEIINRKLKKDDVIIGLFIKKINSDYVFSPQIYELKYFPNIDSIKIYNGVRIHLTSTTDIIKLLSSKLKPLKETRKVVEIDTDIYTIHETLANSTFQFNENFEIYFLATSDNAFYIEKLRSHKIKIAKELN